MKALELLQELVDAYGPPGQEDEVRSVVARQATKLGFECWADAKGNLVVGSPRTSEKPSLERFLEDRPTVLVTVHLDEIAMIVRRIEPDGRILVASLGGLYPWKLGEGPVELLGRDPVPGVLSFGGIHTEDPAAASVQAKEGSLKWEMATVFTGLSPSDLLDREVRPGTRIVVARHRRKLWEMGEFVAGHFLDDRADLAAMILALEALESLPEGVVFAATAAEEVGGEGAMNLMHRIRPDICIALELAPLVPDAPIRLDASPVLWVNDGYSAPQPRDNETVAAVAKDLGQDLQYQALSRGGSDASCAASHGLCARPITLGIPMENSHGYEIMHRQGVDELTRLTVGLVQALSSDLSDSETKP